MSSGEFTVVRGRRVRYYRWGEGGPAVVFESGLYSPGFVWKPVAAALAEDTTVVAHDRPGYGRSAPGRRPRSAQQVADELAELIDALGVAPCVLVGHSFGGLVIDRLAEVAPSLVAGLVFVDAGDPHEFVRQGRSSGAPFRRFRRATRASAVLPAAAWCLAQAGLARPVVHRLPPVRSGLGPLIERLPTFWDDADSTIHPAYFRAVVDELWSWPDSLADAGADSPSLDVPVMKITATHTGLSEGILGRSWRRSRPRLPSHLLAHLRSAESLSTNWSWRAVRGPHELVVTAPDDVAAAVLDVVRVVRDGGRLPTPFAAAVPRDELDLLTGELGDRPRLALNLLGSDARRVLDLGASETLVSESLRRVTRRSLRAWSRSWGECASIEPVDAVDYGWTLIVRYRADFASGIVAGLDVHLDEAHQIADLAVSRD